MAIDGILVRYRRVCNNSTREPCVLLYVCDVSCIDTDLLGLETALTSGEAKSMVAGWLAKSDRLRSRSLSRAHSIVLLVRKIPCTVQVPAS